MADVISKILFKVNAGRYGWLEDFYMRDTNWPVNSMAGASFLANVRNGFLLPPYFIERCSISNTQVARQSMEIDLIGLAQPGAGVSNNLVPPYAPWDCTNIRLSFGNPDPTSATNGILPGPQRNYFMRGLQLNAWGGSVDTGWSLDPFVLASIVNQWANTLVYARNARIGQFNGLGPFGPFGMLGNGVPVNGGPWKAVILGTAVTLDAATGYTKIATPPGFNWADPQIKFIVVQGYLGGYKALNGKHLVAATDNNTVTVRVPFSSLTGPLQQTPDAQINAVGTAFYRFGGYEIGEAPTKRNIGINKVTTKGRYKRRPSTV